MASRLSLRNGVLWTFAKRRLRRRQCSMASSMPATTELLRNIHSSAKANRMTPSEWRGLCPWIAPRRCSISSRRPLRCGQVCLLCVMFSRPRASRLANQGRPRRRTLTLNSTSVYCEASKSHLKTQLHARFRTLWCSAPTRGSEARDTALRVRLPAPSSSTPRQLPHISDYTIQTPRGARLTWQ